MGKFEQLTIVVLASTEQETLKETVRLIGENCDAADITELIIFLISADCPSTEVAKQIVDNNPFAFPIRYCFQKTKGLAMTVYEIPQLIQTSHFLFLGSDMEMDPLTIPQMIAISKNNPDAIVCASKFLKGAKRENYGSLHYLCNRAVNRAMELILHIKGTELMSFYQIYPKALYDRLDFSEPKRAYYQYSIRPILDGAPYIEVPTNYTRRTEGASNYNLSRYIDLACNFLSAAVLERRKKKTGKSK